MRNTKGSGEMKYRRVYYCTYQRVLEYVDDEIMNTLNVINYETFAVFKLDISDSHTHTLHLSHCSVLVLHCLLAVEK